MINERRAEGSAPHLEQAQQDCTPALLAVAAGAGAGRGAAAVAAMAARAATLLARGAIAGMLCGALTVVTAVMVVSAAAFIAAMAVVATTVVVLALAARLTVFGRRGVVVAAGKFVARFGVNRRGFAALGFVARRIVAQSRRVATLGIVRFAAVVFVGIRMRGAEAVVTDKGALLGFGLGVGIITGRRWLARRGRGTTLAATLRGTVVELSAAPTAASATTAATATATTAASLALVVVMTRAGLLATLARWTGRPVAVGTRGLGFRLHFEILVFVLVFEIVHPGRRSIGGPGGARRGDGLRLLREILAGGELHITRGEAGKFRRAKEARGLGGGGGADDDLRNGVARAQAQEVFDGVGDEFGVDGALRVEGHGGLGRGLRVGARIHGGGADAIVAQLVKEGFGEMVESAFDGGGDGTAGRGAVAVPAEDDEVALFLAQPWERGAGEGEGCDEAGVDARGQFADRGVEQRHRRAARGVHDEAHMPFARHDVLSHLGEGGGVGEVAGDGEEVVVREGIAGELGGEGVNPAAQADQAPGDGEPRPGIGAGN